MLTFLALAAGCRLVVDRYADAATGEVGPDADRRPAVVRVTLRPTVVFSGPPPTDDVVDALHHAAHAGCVIARSIRAAVMIHGTWRHAADDAADDAAMVGGTRP